MRIRFTFFCLLIAAFVTNSSQAQFISTFAGDGAQGYAGDGGVCSKAELNSCSAVAFDGAGNVYIADAGNNVVRKVNTSGLISTLAGNGSKGYSGDGGLAIYAKLNKPSGVAVDVNGSVYISDNGNNVIRLVQTNGIISTYAGNGSAGYSGDNGAATAAMLSGPSGIAVDGSGTLYIADAGNNAVRKVYTSGTIITIAGDGSASYSGDGGFADFSTLSNPTAVAIDPLGQVYIADNANQVIRMIDTSYVIHTFAGNGVPGYAGNGGPATAAQLLFPTGVAVYGFGDVYIADQGNVRVRHVNSSGMISNFAGNGASGYYGDGGYAVSAELKAPVSVAADGDNRVYIADQGNNVVRLISDVVSVKPVTVVSNEIKVYPNPTSGAFSVDVPGTGNDATLTITDVLGRTVSSSHLGASDQVTSLHFNGLIAGSYFIKLDAGNSTGRSRVEVW